MTNRLAFKSCILFFLSLPGHSLNIFAQTQDLVIDHGMMGLVQALERLPLTSRVMFIAAHPDDETAGVLTYVSRGLHAKTALLTLTRGEGGQNLISSDLFDALGLLRTGELLAADEYYGVRQFFTRAFDFGFSKSSAETLQKWGPETVLSDMVRAIRTFRPDVVISVWQGNAKDGHGHHQAAGILAREAFQLAGDLHSFSDLAQEGLVPWQAKKFYVGNLEEKEPASFAVNIGEFVPLLGASFQEIGSQGYSLHRTQGMGSSYSGPGNHRVRYRLVSPVESQDAGFLDHLNVSLSGLAELLKPEDPQRSWLESQLRELEGLIKEAQSYCPLSEIPHTYDPLLRGVTKLRAIREGISLNKIELSSKNHLLFLLADKEQDFLKAVEIATGLSFEVLTDDALPTPGQSFTVTARVTNRSSCIFRLKGIQLQAKKNWKIEPIEGSLKDLGPGDKADLKFRVSVPPNAAPTQPHWRRENKSATFYTILQEPLINSPLSPPILNAKLSYFISLPGKGALSAAPLPTVSSLPDQPIQEVYLTKEQPVEYLDSDPLRGTHRIPILVVPELTMEVTPALQLVALETSSQPRKIQVELLNNSKSQLEGYLVLRAPPGWRVDPEQQPFFLNQRGEAITLQFKAAATGELRAGTGTFEAIARIQEREFDQSYRTVSVMNLWKNPLYRKAAAEVVALDVKVPQQLSVGYIMGAGDRVPQTLSELGIQVKLLEAEDLVGMNLSQFSCLIAGIRAYDVRKDLIANNRRLLAYVKNGGVYIVQYNTPSAWNSSQFAPYPSKIKDARHRVTDETAPVRILDPRHPVFNFPNKISDQDFQGWVQERGLYFIQERDSHFKPLLSSNDPGDPPLDGGLLVAEYGRGLYVLTSYAWFRQLPEGVPGAIRIFANLISLAKNHAH